MTAPAMTPGRRQAKACEPELDRGGQALLAEDQELLGVVTAYCGSTSITHAAGRIPGGSLASAKTAFDGGSRRADDIDRPVLLPGRVAAVHDGRDVAQDVDHLGRLVPGDERPKAGHRVVAGIGRPGLGRVAADRDGLQLGSAAVPVVTYSLGSPTDDHPSPCAPP